jgi:hypothetical protein
MFNVSVATAQAIRQAFEEGGEIAAAAEFRRHFPGITNDEIARSCAKSISGWKPFLPRQKVRKFFISFASIGRTIGETAPPQSG